MAQFNDLLKIFESAQNQYLQLRKEEDGTDALLEDIDNWVFEFKHKTYNWLREVERERESVQCLQEGATNQVKVDHLAVQKILTLLLIQKSQGV